MKAARLGVFDDIRRCLIQNDVKRARRAVHVAAAKRLSRPQRVELAYLARQASLSHLSLKLVFRAVRGNVAGGPTRHELGEYGLALAALGQSREAIGVLSRLDARSMPWVARGLVLSYFRISEWKRTLPMIERHLGLARQSKTDRLWWRCLHGIALLYGARDPRAAIGVLQPLILDAERENYPEVQRDVLRMLSLCHYYLGDAKRSSQALAPLERIVAAMPESVIGKLTLQQRLLIDARAGAIPVARAAAGLRAVRAWFESIGVWHRVRYLDLDLAWLTYDVPLFERLFFGTPGAAAKEHIAFHMRASDRARLPAHYDWNPAREAPGSRSWIDVRSCFKAGQLAQRTLSALCDDFYLPNTAPSLFARIYPGEYYDMTTARQRVAWCLQALRREISSARLPIEIAESDGRYRLMLPRAWSVRLFKPEAAAVDWSERRGSVITDRGGGGLGVLKVESPASLRARECVRRLEAAFGDAEFRAADLQKLVGGSERAARYRLEEAIRMTLLESRGKARLRRYRVRRGRPAKAR